MTMNGAQALIRTLVDAGVDVCFTNPGTSEMHFVAAVDEVAGHAHDPRPVRGCRHRRGRRVRPHGRPSGGHPAAPRTGHGQRHGQPAQRPPGRRADGQHRRATTRRTTSSTTRRSSPTSTPPRPRSPAGCGGRCRPRSSSLAAAEAVAAAIGPPAADRRRSSSPPTCRGARARRRRRPCRHERARRSPTTSSSGWPRCWCRASRACCCWAERPTARPRSVDASRIASATGARMLTETFPTRLERGAGVPAIDRLQYLSEFAVAQLEGTRHLILVDASSPVVVLRLSRQGQRPRARGLRGARARRGRPTTRRGRSPTSPIGWRPTSIRCWRRRAGPTARLGALTAEAVALARRRAAARGGGGGRRGGDVGHLGARRHRRGTEARLAHAHRRRHRHRPAPGGGRGCRRARPEGDRPSRPTAARCTRSRRSGRWRASSSTSPR